MSKKPNSNAGAATHARALLLGACLLLSTMSIGMQRHDAQDTRRPTLKIHGRKMSLVALVQTLDWFTVHHVDNELKRLGIEVHKTYWMGVERVDVPVEDHDLAVRVLRSDVAHADYWFSFYKGRGGPQGDELEPVGRVRRHPWNEVACDATAAQLAAPTSTLRPCELQRALVDAVHQGIFHGTDIVSTIRFAPRPYVDDHLDWVIGYDVIVILQHPITSAQTHYSPQRSFAFVLPADAPAIPMDDEFPW